MSVGLAVRAELKTAIFPFLRKGAYLGADVIFFFEVSRITSFQRSLYFLTLQLWLTFLHLKGTTISENNTVHY